MRLRFSKLALEDITLIHDFTVGEWGEEQAVKYVGALWDALEEIAADPERWRLRPDIYRGSRARVCGSHLIIYRTRDGRVEISRILHGAMRSPRAGASRFHGRRVVCSFPTRNLRVKKRPQSSS